MMFSARQMRLFAAVGVVALALTHDAWSQGPSYQLVEGFFKLPAGRKIGSTAGITSDRDGRSIWVFDRCGDQYCAGAPDVAPIQKFDASGRLLVAFGSGMINYPHGLHIDADGNVWVTDNRGTPARDGRPGKGHVVWKFAPDGKVLMTLGKPGVAGNANDTFNAPSDVITNANGDIFVADGHGEMTNARIVKFDKTGKFIKAWGTAGSGQGQFNEPHGLAMNSQAAVRRRPG